jgi:hypothetical protein
VLAATASSVSAIEFLGNWYVESIAIYYAANAPSIPNSAGTLVNASNTSGTYNANGFQLLEFSGVYALDKTTSLTDPPQPDNPINAGTLTASNTDLLLVLANAPLHNSQTTAGSGMTLTSMGGSGFYCGACQYLLNASPGSYATSFTGSAGPWVCAAVSFGPMLGLCGVVKPTGNPYLTMGGSGPVMEVDTGTGLTGGPITTTGTISMANETPNTLAGYNSSGVFVDVTVGTNLTLSGNILSASGSGSVTSVGTGTGLTGGPITSSGTISMANSTANSLAGYDNSGHFIDVTVGTNLTLSGGILSASGGSGSGTVTSVSAGTGLSASPSPITTSGSLAIASTGVTAGSYTNANLTVNAQGQITAVSNGVGGGSGNGALVLLQSLTASSSATLDFDSCITSAYDDYEIHLIDVIPATNGSNFEFVLSTNGGSSFDTTTANYNSLYNNGWVNSSSGGGTNNVLPNISGIGNGTGQSLCGRIRLYNPLGSSYKKMEWHAVMYYTAVSSLLNQTGGSWYLNTSAVNAIRFLFSSGNIASGTIRVYGVANSSTAANSAGISAYLCPTTVILPTFTGFAYKNNATYTTNAAGAYVIATYNSPNPEIMGTTSLSGSYDIIGCFVANPPLSSGKAVSFSINIWDSVSGKIVTIEPNLTQESSNPTWFVKHYPSFSGGPSNAFSVTTQFSTVAPTWMRINCNSTTNIYTFYVSVDGQSWDQIYSESTTAYMTNAANSCGFGFYCSSSSASGTQHCVVPYFVVIPH